MRALALLLLSPAPALACTMLLPSPDLRLPGEEAGPEAVFSSDRMGGQLYGPDGTEIPVSHLTFTSAGREGHILVPEAPLAPGLYQVSDAPDPETCSGDLCDVTIADGAGDPGVPPDPPTVTLENTRVASGRRADCGPVVGATIVTAESDARVVVLAESPLDSLDGAELVAVLRPDGEGVFVDTTKHAGDVFAAAVDAEGELSAWTPVTLSPGCSTTGRAPLGLAALLVALGLGAARRSGGRG